MEAKKTTVNSLFPYQQNDIETIFGRIGQSPNSKFLYQLPTGGGKTVVFAEIVRRFLIDFNKTVAVLTHRKELCAQTSKTLKRLGVKNSIINSKTKTIKTD